MKTLKQILRAATIVSDSSIDLNQGAMSPKLFLEVDDFFKAIGGKWNKRKMIFEFPASESREWLELKFNHAVKVATQEQLYLDVQNPRTPAKIAGYMAEYLRYEVTDPVSWILEPSAGDGVLMQVVSKMIPDAPIVFCENDQKNLDILKRICEANPNDFVYTQTPDFFDLKTKEMGGSFRKMKYIIAHPPFADHAWMDHVEHMVKIAEPGGRIVSLIPKRIPRGDELPTKEILQYLDEETEYWRIIDLPDDLQKLLTISSELLIIDR